MQNNIGNGNGKITSMVNNPTNTGIKLLVVEDNPGDARLIKIFLSSVKSIAISIENAERLSDALAYLDGQTVDAVLLDLSLPDSQGLDTLSRLYSQASKLPILVLTGLDDEAMGLEAIQHGAQDYLVKGHIDGPLLERTIRYAIERKGIEGERQEKEAAERANLAKTEFLSKMSHELRTPLNAILGFAQLLQMDELTPAQYENLDYIMKGGKHLLTLIDDVLDISRIESGRFSISLEPVNVREMLTECVNMLRNMAGTKQVQIQYDASSVHGGYVLADRHRLKQVVLNLLSNSIKYNKAGGSVTVTCVQGAAHPAPEGSASDAPMHDTLRISVSDTGRGIPDNQMQKLFMPFERLGVERSGVEGTGLGLALSKHLIQTMHGAVGAESKFEVGSTFWVELPQAVEYGEEPPEQLTGPLELLQLDRMHTILYIEDNLSNLKLVERILAHVPKLNLMSAMQGGLGLDLARLHTPDLILLDLHLPDISGREVLYKLREDPDTKDIPVIMLSAEQSPSRISMPEELDVHAYVSKPLNVQEFLNAVYYALKD